MQWHKRESTLYPQRTHREHSPTPSAACLLWLVPGAQTAVCQRLLKVWGQSWWMTHFSNPLLSQLSPNRDCCCFRMQPLTGTPTFLTAPSPSLQNCSFYQWPESRKISHSEPLTQTGKWRPLQKESKNSPKARISLPWCSPLPRDRAAGHPWNTLSPGPCYVQPWRKNGHVSYLSEGIKKR